MSNERKLRNFSEGDKVRLLRNLDTCLRADVAKKYDVNVSTINHTVSKRSSRKTCGKLWYWRKHSKLKKYISVRYLGTKTSTKCNHRTRPTMTIETESKKLLI